MRHLTECREFKLQRGGKTSCVNRQSVLVRLWLWTKSRLEQEKNGSFKNDNASAICKQVNTVCSLLWWWSKKKYLDHLKCSHYINFWQLICHIFMIIHVKFKYRKQLSWRLLLWDCQYLSIACGPTRSDLKCEKNRWKLILDEIQ